MARDPGRVLIFDTTLRDGEQSPGASLNLDEKLAIAQQLARLGVDIIEAGFPFASPGDFEAVQRIAASVGTPDGPVICGLARATKGDIKACADAVAPAANRRIHTFLATSDIHLEHKLRKSRAEVLQIVPEMVAYARSLVEDVEFSCEDAGRSDPEFMHQVIEAAIAAGATTINIPDTVGYTTPGEFGALIADINSEVPNIDQAVISVHGHNDLGLAVANFLEAVKSGARQLECTINGIGERAGNTSLEEVIMALRTRAQHFPVCVDVDTKQIVNSSKMVSSYTGINVQANKAIVGANAFAHESGIHQHGVLANASTYEIMTPASIGIDGDRGSLVLGKLSGKAAFRQRLLELGYEDVANDKKRLHKLVEEAKAVADKKKMITDSDLEALLGDSRMAGLQDHWECTRSPARHRAWGARMRALGCGCARSSTPAERLAPPQPPWQPFLSPLLTC